MDERLPRAQTRREWLTSAGGGLALAGAQGASAQAQTGWKAGTARVAITPREPVWLAGYGNRTRPSEGVLRDLYVKALALQQGSGPVSVLVTSDLLGFPREVADPITEACRAQYGLPRERVALNSSHTHSAPVLGRMLRPAYPEFTREQEAAVGRYTQELIPKVVAAVGDAIKSAAPAELSFAQGLAGFGVNRRRVTKRNLPGPVDQDVPVLAVRDPGGKLRAVVFGYACHNTSLGNYQVNGDWAGFAQGELESTYPDATALFVEGCGADINPLPRYQGNDPKLEHYSVELSRLYGKICAAAVDIALHERMKPVRGAIDAAFGLVDLPFHNPPSRDELNARLQDQSPANASRRRHARLMLSILERDGKLPDRYPYPLQVWRFGADINFIVMGGEVVVDYSLRLKAQYGWDNTWVAGYSNDVFAYIPSRRVLMEGGYEGADAMIGYGQPGPFGAGVEEIVVEKIADLMRAAGRS